MCCMYGIVSILHFNIVSSFCHCYYTPFCMSLLVYLSNFFGDIYSILLLQLYWNRLHLPEELIFSPDILRCAKEKVRVKSVIIRINFVRFLYMHRVRKSIFVSNSRHRFPFLNRCSEGSFMKNQNFLQGENSTTNNDIALFD